MGRGKRRKGEERGPEKLMARKRRRRISGNRSPPQRRRKASGQANREGERGVNISPQPTRLLRARNWEDPGHHSWVQGCVIPTPETAMVVQ